MKFYVIQDSLGNIYISDGIMAILLGILLVSNVVFVLLYLRDMDVISLLKKDNKELENAVEYRRQLHNNTIFKMQQLKDSLGDEK